MTIAEIVEIESNRKEQAQFGVVHLLKESNFYRAHDWSAWLLKTFPVSEEPMKPTVKRLKNGYLEVWVGFPVTSLGKFIPEAEGVVFNHVSDNQIDVVIPITDDIASSDTEQVRALVDEWKESLPIVEDKKQRRESREVSEFAPRVTRITDVLARIISFPLESKSPLEAYEFLRDLRMQVAGMF